MDIQGSKEVYDAYIRQEHHDSQTEEGFITYFNKNQHKTTNRCFGKGIGMGFEGDILLESPVYQAAILIRKIPGGNYGVGVQTRKQFTYPKIEQNPDKIMNEIKSSPNFSEGSGLIINDGQFQVMVSAPGSFVEIKIQESTFPTTFEKVFSIPGVLVSTDRNPENKYEIHDFSRFQAFWNGFQNC